MSSVDISKMSGPDLVKLHNSMSSKPVSRFGSIAAGRRRVQALLDAKEGKAPAEKPAKPYKEGTLAKKLSEGAKRDTKREIAEGKAKGKLLGARVRATDAGVSKLQSGSIRAAVFNVVKESGKRGIALEEIAVKDPETKAKVNPRGYISKLLDKGHIEVMA